jgi:hypothetical protein
MKTRLALLLCTVGVSGYAQTPATFTEAGGMWTARSGHTSTVLPNGKVLIAGGENGPQIPAASHYLASAELYDPSTGFFTRTGDMITARSGHSATLLPDGRVLITGGIGASVITGGVAVASTELYDPSTGTFKAAGGTSSVSGIATLLKNGKVLITGNAAELYDPVTDSFTPTAPYAGPFYYGSYFYPDTATLLQDGRVLIAGSACGDCWLEHEEVYDPVTGTFKAVGALYTCSAGCVGYIWSGHTATLLQNGKVLLAGGVSEDFGVFSNAELYDPSTDTITPTGNMNIARAGHTATLLTDGTVLAAGGQFYDTLIDVELYDPASGTFSYTAHMTMPRAFHSAALLFDGRVLTSGGVGGGDDWLNTAELYTPGSLAPAPALFSLSGDGTGQGAIWHADTGQVASPGNPAAAGDVLSMYTTSLFEGGVIPPQVAIGGQLAEIPFFGDAPGYPGYYQVNFRVPSGVAPGSAVTVRLTYLSRASNAVSIGVR